jgi:hypothetical protein
MEFTVTKRIRVEMGDWDYYQITAQTKNGYPDDDPQWKLRPKAVAEIQFNCSLEEGERLPRDMKLTLEPVPGFVITAPTDKPVPTFVQPGAGHGG